MKGINNSPQASNQRMSESDAKAFGHVIRWLQDHHLGWLANILSHLNKTANVPLDSRTPQSMPHIFPGQAKATVGYGSTPQMPPWHPSPQYPQPGYTPRGSQYPHPPPAYGQQQWGATSGNPPQTQFASLSDQTIPTYQSFFVPTGPKTETHGSPSAATSASKADPAATVDSKITAAKQCLDRGMGVLKIAGELAFVNKMVPENKRFVKTQTAHAMLTPTLALIRKHFEALRGKEMKLQEGNLPVDIAEATDFADKFLKKSKESIIQAAKAADDAIKSSDDTVALGQDERMERKQTWQKVFFEQLGIEVPQSLLSPMPTEIPAKFAQPEQPKLAYVENPPGQPPGIYQKNQDGSLQKIQPSTLEPHEKIEATGDGLVVIPRGFMIFRGSICKDNDIKSFSKQMGGIPSKLTKQAVEAAGGKYVDTWGNPVYTAPLCLRELPEGCEKELSEIYEKHTDGLYYRKSVINAIKPKPDATTSKPAAEQVRINLTPIAATTSKPAAKGKKGKRPHKHSKRPPGASAATQGTATPQPSTTPAAPSKPEAGHTTATPSPGASAATQGTATPQPSTTPAAPSKPEADHPTATPPPDASDVTQGIVQPPQPSTTPAAPSKPEADHPNATPLPGASAATPPPSSSRVLPSRPAVRPTTIQPLGNPGADKDLSATMRDNFLEAFKTKLPELVLDSDGLQTSKDIESLFQKNTTARYMSTFQYAGSLQLFANDVLGLDDQGFEFLSVTPEDMQKLKNDMLEAFDRYTES